MTRTITPKPTTRTVSGLRIVINPPEFELPESTADPVRVFEVIVVRDGIGERTGKHLLGDQIADYLLGMNGSSSRVRGVTWTAVELARFQGDLAGDCESITTEAVE